MKRTWMFRLVLGLFLCLSVFAYISAPWGTQTAAQASSESEVSAAFELVLGDKNFGDFDVCNGIGSRSEVITSGAVKDDGAFETQEPGLTIFPNITMSRPIISGVTGLWDIRHNINEGHPEYSTYDEGVITMSTGAGKEPIQWLIKEAWPISVTNQGGREVLVLSVSKVTRVN